jgi:hypothetical protein
MVGGVGPGCPDRQRDAPAIHHQGVLRPLPAAVEGAGAGRLAAAEGPERHPVDDDRVGVELAGPLQRPEQVGVQPGPDAQGFPGPQAAGRRAARTPHLGRDVLPAAAGRQDEPDDPQDLAVRDRRPSPLAADRLLRRQVVDDLVVELLGHAGGGHGVGPPVKDRRHEKPSDHMPITRFCPSL